MTIEWFTSKFLGKALIVFSLGVCVSACSVQDKTNNVASSKGTQESANVTIAGYSAGGQVSLYGEGVAAMVRHQYPGSNAIYEPGNPAGSLEKLRRGDRALALESLVEVKLALEGAPPFKQPFPQDKLTAVVNAIPGGSALLIYARKDFLESHGIRSFGDLVNKRAPVRLSINQPGNLWARAQIDKLFEAYGAKTTDVENWGGTLVPQVTTTSHDLMRDGRLDMIITGGGVPSAAVAELGHSIALEFVPISADAAKQVAEAFGNQVKSIPAGTYTFLKQDLDNVVFADMGIVAGPAATDEQTYMVAKAMHQQLKRYQGLHPGLKGVTPEVLPRFGDLKLHPGAEKYYREAGLVP